MKRISLYLFFASLLFLFSKSANADSHPTRSVTQAGITYDWSGALSILGNNWSNPLNWLPIGVPGPGDDVRIGVSVVILAQPVVDGSFTVNSITFGTNYPLLATQVSLSVQGGGSLTVSGSMTINTGSVTTIQRSGITGTANVFMAPASQLNVAGTGTLNITATALLTLQSSATGDASVGQLATGAITGIVNVERFMQGGNVNERGFRLMSSPVYVPTSNPHVYNLDYIKATAVVTGAAGGGFDKTGNPTLYLFREDLAPSNAYFGAGCWPGISKINNSPTSNLQLSGGTTIYSLAPGAGFLFFFRGDRTSAAIATETTIGYVPVSATFTAKGTLNIGQVTAPVWYNFNSTSLGYSGTGTGTNAQIRGFNAVGNPYACAINWDLFQTLTSTNGIYGVNIKGGITPGTGTMWVLDPVSKTYGSYTSGDLGVGSQAFVSKFISSGQGFFVQTTAAGGQLIFNELAKSISAQNTGGKLLMSDQLVTAAQPQYLRLQFFKDSVNSEQTTVRFISQTSTDTMMFNESHFEGYGGVSLASLSGNNENMGINTAKFPGNQSTVIKLNINATTTGTYQLKLRDLVAVPRLYDIWLMDAYKKDSLNLRTGIYSLDINKADSASFGNSRLTLVIRQNADLAYHLLDFSADKIQNSHRVQVLWKTENEENYTNFTVERSTDNGRKFEVLGSVKANGSGSYSFIDKDPDHGRNFYRLKQQDLNNVTSYSKTEEVKYFNHDDDKLHIYPNPAAHMINLDLSAKIDGREQYDIQVSNCYGFIVRQATSSQTNWQTNISSLRPGTYLVRVLGKRDRNLIGQAKFVKL